jgi:hypothetical protein
MVALTPSDGTENGGKLDVQPHSPEKVHIVHMTVNKHSNTERIEHLPLVSFLDGDAIIIFCAHLSLCMVVA